MTAVVLRSIARFELCKLLCCCLFLRTKGAVISIAVRIRSAAERPMIPPLDSEDPDRAKAFVVVGWAMALDAAELKLVDAGGVPLQVGLPSGTIF